MRTIDADALIEKYGEWYTEEGDESGFIGTIEDIVNTMPVIVPERMNGRWINHRNDNGHNIADCNICGNPIQWFDDDEKPRFCRMCGARMEEGGE